MRHLFVKPLFQKPPGCEPDDDKTDKESCKLLPDAIVFLAEFISEHSLACISYGGRSFNIIMNKLCGDSTHRIPRWLQKSNYLILYNSGIH